MDPQRIEQELADLRRRVTELEAHVRLTAAPGDASPAEPAPTAPRTLRDAAAILHRLATPVPAIPDRPASPALQQPPPHVPQQAFAESADDVPPAKRMIFDDRGCLVPASSLWTEAERRQAQGTPEPEAAPSAPSVPPTPPITPHAPRPTAAEMELRIGANWMAWAGALLVILASGFFVKFAYDQGWLGLIPKVIRCLACAALGGALIAAGEVALRRIGRHAAVGLFAAGLGVLYVTADASFRYFELVSTNTAFLLAFIVALVGVAITIRGQMVVIGVLSLIGGYVAPIILGGRDNPASALGIYLTMLLSIALALSFWKPAPYQAVRTTAMILHGLLATVWMVGQGRDAPFTCVSFAAFWWMLVNAEVLATVLRGGPAGGGARASFAATAWLAGLGAWTIAAASPVGREWLGIYTGTIAVLLGGLLLLARQPLTVLSRRPAASIEKLCVSYWSQIGVLVTVAIGLHFDGRTPGQSLCWLALALGSVELGRRLPSLGASVFGLIVGVLALFNIVSFDAYVEWMRQPLVVIGEHHALKLSPLALLCLTAIAATIAAALRVRLDPNPSADESPRVLTGVACVTWLIWAAQYCSGATTGLAWALGGAGLLATRRFGVAQHFAGFGLALIAVATIRWLFIDQFAARGTSAWTPNTETLLLNLPLATGILLACLVQWSARVVSTSSHDASSVLVPFARSTAPLLLVVALSFELERAIGLHGQALVSRWGGQAVRLAALSAFWGAAAAVIVLYGTRKGDAVVAHVGRALSYFAAFVWMVPTALAARVWRAPAEVWLLFNLQALAGMLIAAAITWIAISTTTDATHRRVSWAFVGLLGLWIGSIELDRAVAIYRDSLPATAMARQAGLSVYWGLYAIIILTIGFVRWQRECRWAGLALLSITAAKVLLIDMAAVAYGYRVLSFFVTGVLFIGVSVVYARIARDFAATRLSG